MLCSTFNIVFKSLLQSYYFFQACVQRMNKVHYALYSVYSPKIGNQL